MSAPLFLETPGMGLGCSQLLLLQEGKYFLAGKNDFKTMLFAVRGRPCVMFSTTCYFRSIIQNRTSGRLQQNRIDFYFYFSVKICIACGLDAAYVFAKK